MIWGEHDRVILMLEVKHFSKNCSNSRNVAFLLDTGAPFTVISSAVRRLILKDCKLIEKKRIATESRNKN